MDKHSCLEKIVETMALSPLPIALFQIEMRKFKTVAMTTGLLDALNLDEEEARKKFDEDPYFLSLPEDKPALMRAMDNFLVGKSPFDEAVRIRFSNHTTYHEVRAVGKRFHFENRLYAYFLFTDLSPFLLTHADTLKAPLRMRNKVLGVKQELFDPMTGFPTMAFFYELGKVGVQSALSREGVCAMLAFDFMGMKSYNLKFGNEKGNDLIRGFARILNHYFTPLCVARFSADHFYAFTPLKDVEAILARVFEEAKSLNGGDSLPIRVGIYRIREGQNASMVSYCDKAKFACDYDRSTYSSHFTYFTLEMERAISMRDYVLSHVDEALEKGWIKAYYQPIFRSVTGFLCAEEALARWEDPALGVIEPKDFIPYLEEAHLLYKVDLRIVELIVRDFKTKQQAGVPLVPVSINLSRFDFEKIDMVEEIGKTLSEAGYPPSLITVEITEAVAGTAPTFISKQISRLHEAGFKVWMDDFGSGYSSLNVLTDFDFDLVKFDMKFIKSFSNNPKSAPLLASLLEMAQNLGIDTLCEGVETRDQMIFLQNHGCDRLQGFYFQKPSSLGQILMEKGKFLRESKKDAPYYQKVGEYSLFHPACLEREIQGKIAGILEYQNGNFDLLRATADYRAYLEKTQAINLSSFSKTKLPFLKPAPSSFVATVERCIASGKPESTSFAEENMPFFQATVTEIARKTGLNPSYAIFVDFEPCAEASAEDASFPTAFEAKLLRDDSGKPVDIFFLNCFSNSPFLSKETRKRMTSRALSEVAPDFNRVWLSSAEQCLAKNKPVHGATYLDSLEEEVAYVCFPDQEKKDVFSCRLFGLSPEEYSELRARDILGGHDLLYRISSLLAKESGLSCLMEVFEKVCKGLDCSNAGLYLPSGDGCLLFSSAKSSSLPRRLSGEFLSVCQSDFAEKGYWDSKMSPMRIPGFKGAILLQPFGEGGSRGGYFALEGYPKEKKEEALVVLKELARLLSPRLSSLLKKPKKKAPKKQKLLKPFSSWGAPSLAERECIESYNCGFLCFGAPFFFLLFAVLSFLGTRLSVAPAGMDLYRVSGYILPRYIGFGLYLVVSLFAFVYALLVRMGKIRASHRFFSVLLGIYLTLSCFLSVLFSWQDHQLGSMSLTYSITLLYIFASFRLGPIKTLILLATSFSALTLLIVFFPCLGGEYASFVKSGLTSLYWTMQIVTILIALFLEIVLHFLFLRMLKLATIDPLTKTRNRFALNLDKNRYYGSPVFIMVLDINDFKHWNDTYGHEKGDELLVSFASALRDSFGAEEVYRFGGDEFLVIKAEDRVSFERRVGVFEASLGGFFGDKEKISFTAGFQEVTFQDDKSFLACASSCDALLYEGKKTGKSTIVGR